MTGLSALAVDVRDRVPGSDGSPTLAQLLADRPADGAGGVDVVEASEHGVAGEGRPIVLMEPGDVAALFVDGR